MIRKLMPTFVQDFLLTFRSGHIYVILGLACLMLVLAFALPPEIDMMSAEAFYDASADGIF
jgi:predicted cobalt transporter CbtA